MKKRTQSESSRYALYARVSTEDQVDRAFASVEAQLETLRAWVTERGGEIVAEYIEEGVSGTKSKRPVMTKLINEIAVRGVGVVLTTSLCRLGRGAAYHVLENRIHEEGATVRSVDEPEGDDVGAQIQIQAKQFINGLYPVYIKHQTKNKMKQMVARGYVAGFLPFGLRAVALEEGDRNSSKVAKPHPEEAPIVVAAFDVYIQKRTLAAVRQFLNDSTSRKWTTTTVKHLISNRAYVGVQEFGEWTNETAWEPIVDRGVFEKAQEILASQVRAVRSPRSDDYVYLLRELIWCPHCGCRYTPSVAKGGAVRYYECLHGKKKLSNCPVARVNCDALHRTILAELARHAEHQTVMHQAIAESHAWSEPEQEKVALRAALAEQRRQLSIKQSNLLKAIENGQVIQKLLDRLQELEQEIKILDARILEADELIARSTAKRPTAQQVQAVWTSALSLWEQADDDQRQTILRGLVQRVEMRDKDRAVVSISPFFYSEPLGFGTTEKMGAGIGFEPMTSGL